MVTEAEIQDAKQMGCVDMSIIADSIDDIKRVCEVETLEKLRISGTVEELPAEIGALSQLEKLSLNCNVLTTLPPTIGQLTSLKNLWAYTNKMTHLPDEFGQLAALESASLWSNELSSLPATIGGLTSLISLDLKRNKLRTLPKALGQLSQLRELILQTNELKTMPQDLSGMTSLTTLDLANNEFSKFPSGLLTLPGLVYLDLSGNALTRLPDDIDRLAGLRRLGLDVTNWAQGPKNQIAALPEGLFRLAHLERLTMRHNALKTIPQALSEMPSLRQVRLEGNPVDDVPGKVLAKGMQAIFVHLGFREPLVLEAPDAKALKAAKKRHAVVLKTLRREARHRVSDDKVNDVMGFLEGSVHEIPSMTQDDHYAFQDIKQLLPLDGQWDCIAERGLALMAGDAWEWMDYNNFSNREYAQGFHDEFTDWLVKAVADEGDRDTTSDALVRLARFGIDDPEHLACLLARECGRGLLDDEGQPTSIGRQLLAWAPSHTDAILAHIYDLSAEGPFLELLLRHRPGLIDDRVEGILFREEKDSETRHAPFSDLERLMKIDAGRFEPLVLRAMEWSDCPECKAEIARLLVTYFGDEHRAQAQAAVEAAFVHITQDKNSEGRGYFRWSGAKSMYRDGTSTFSDWALGIFGEDISDAVETCVRETRAIQLDMIEHAVTHLGQRALPMVLEALNMQLKGDMTLHFRRVFAMLSQLDADEALPRVWALVSCENASVRASAGAYLGSLDAPDVDRAIAQLQERDADARDGAVCILAAAGGEAAWDALSQRADIEKNNDVRDRLVAVLYADEKGTALPEVRRRVELASKRGVLKRPPAKWADEAALPGLSWANGDALTADEIRWLLHRQSRISQISLDPEAAGAFAQIDLDTSGDFACALLELAADKGGAVAKNRFAYATGGFLGDERAVELLMFQASSKRRLPAVQALGLMRSDAAARALQALAAQFQTKYTNLGDAAVSGFAAIAARRERSPYELSDGLLDFLGFEDDLTRPMTLGDEAWKLVLQPDLKLAFVSPEGKPRKSAPKTASKAEKAEIKALQAEIKAMGQRQTDALEAYMVARRRWTSEAWVGFFRRHPVMAVLAQRVVWGVYDEEGALCEPFVVDDDLDVPEGALIGLVHPLELSEEARAAWRATLDKQKRAPLFAQLDRPLYTPEPAQLDDGFLRLLEDSTAHAATFKRRADQAGWRRGAVIDGGEVSSYRKLFASDGVEVFVRLQGLNVQSWFDNDEKVTLQQIFFVPPDSVTCGSYTYDEPRLATDERLIPLGQVPPFVYSEAIAELAHIAGVDL